MKKYPLLSFFLIAMFLGAGTIILAIEEIVPPMMILGSVFSASIAGVIMTAVTDGKAGLKTLFSRLLIWKVNPGYWLFATLYLLPTLLIGFIFNPIFDGDHFPFRDFNMGIEFIPMFIAFVVVAGLGQEIGWTGFLLPRLQSRYNALTSSVIRAMLVSIWHTPIFLYSRFQYQALESYPYPGWIAQKGFLTAILVSVLMFQIPWAILWGWLFNNTNGSLLLVAVMHGSEIWTAYMMTNNGIDINNLDNYWGYGGILVITAIILVLFNGPINLSRDKKKIELHSPQN